MLWLIFFLNLVVLPQDEGVSVKIDGLIDLGPQWNFEYRFDPSVQFGANQVDAVRSKKQHHEHKKHKKNVKKRPESLIIDVSNMAETTEVKSKEIKSKEVKSKEVKDFFFNSKENNAFLPQSKESNGFLPKEPNGSVPQSIEAKGLYVKEEDQMDEDEDEDQDVFAKEKEEARELYGFISRTKNTDVYTEATGSVTTSSETTTRTKTTTPRTRTTTQRTKTTTERTRTTTERTRTTTERTRTTTPKTRTTTSKTRTTTSPDIITHPKSRNITRSVTTATTRPTTRPTTRARIETTPTTTTTKKVLRYQLTKNISSLYDITHNVREDTRLQDFTIHLFKQSIKLLDKMKGEVPNPRTVEVLKEAYKQKFTAYVNDTQYKKVKTRLGNQKVLIDTMEHSHRYLKRLVNHLTAHMEDKTVLKHRGMLRSTTLVGMLDTEIKDEHKHVCEKFGLCRHGYGFAEFLADVVSETLLSKDDQMKMLYDTFTEVAKNTDMNKSAVNSDVNKQIARVIDRVERWNNRGLRENLVVTKNLIRARNQPLAIVDGVKVTDLNKTLALMEVVNALHESMKATEEKQQDWQDVLSSLKDLREGIRTDAEEIMKVIVNQFQETLSSMDEHTSDNLNQKLRILLSQPPYIPYSVRKGIQD